MLKKTHKTLFYILILLLPTQLTKHFWPSFAFVSGIRIDYLAPTIYLTDILIIAVSVTWALDYVCSGPASWAKFISIKQARPLVFSIKSIESIIRKATKHPIIFTKSTDGRYLFFYKKIPFIVLTIYMLANILHPTSSWVAFLKWIKIGELALLAYYIIKAKPPWKITSAMLIIGGLYSSMIAWTQFFTGGSIGGLLYWIGERTFTLNTPGIARQSFFGREFLRPYATFPHPNVLAGFLTATLPLILFPQNTTKSDARASKFVVFLLTIIVAIWLATIFITGSQAALIISLGILFLFLPVQHKKPALLLIFAVCILLFSTIHYPPSTILSSKSFTRRWSLSIAAIQMFLTSPIAGIGLNNFVIRLPEFYRLNEPAFFLQPVHNIYLLILTEGGLVGFILFLGMLYKVWKEWLNGYMVKWLKKRKIKKSKNQKIAHQIRNSQFAIRNSLSALLLLGFFDHYLFTLQQGLLLFVIILSLAFLATKKP